MLVQIMEQVLVFRVYLLVEVEVVVQDVEAVDQVVVEIEHLTEEHLIQQQLILEVEEELVQEVQDLLEEQAEMAAQVLLS